MCGVSLVSIPSTLCLPLTPAGLKASLSWMLPPYSCQQWEIWKAQGGVGVQLHLSPSARALAEALGVFAADSVRWVTAQLHQGCGGGRAGLGKLGSRTLLGVTPPANCPLAETRDWCFGGVELQFVTSVHKPQRAFQEEHQCISGYGKR